MIRLCDARRRRRPPVASAAGDRDLQRRVLDLAVEAHPLPLAFDALAALVLADTAALAETLAFAAAVRDLVVADLLRSDGLHVKPTRAALAFAGLERADA